MRFVSGVLAGTLAGIVSFANNGSSVTIGLESLLMAAPAVGDSFKVV